MKAWFEDSRAVTVFSSVLLAYCLGVLDERHYPGGTVVPVDFPEAVLWVTVLFLAGLVTGMFVVEARRP